MKTGIGGTRVVDVLFGEQLPRICCESSFDRLLGFLLYSLWSIPRVFMSRSLMR